MNEFCARALRAGLPTEIRGEQVAVPLLAHGFVKASSVEGLSTIAERSKRVGGTKNAIQPARIRSHAQRLGNRWRGRFRSRSWCLKRSDSATMERTPPGTSRRARVAMKWMKRTTSASHNLMLTRFRSETARLSSGGFNLLDRIVDVRDKQLFFTGGDIALLRQIGY